MTTQPAGGADLPNDQLKEIARAAAQRSAARRAEEAKRIEQARLDHEQRFATAVAALKAEVIALLEQAKLAFESEGMPVHITTNFEHTGAPQANVTFECSGPFWSNSHGAVEFAVSSRAIFFHDGTDFHLGIAKSFSKQATSRARVEGDVAPRVLAAVEEVVESFFRDVERRCRG